MAYLRFYRHLEVLVLPLVFKTVQFSIKGYYSIRTRMLFHDEESRKINAIWSVVNCDEQQKNKSSGSSHFESQRFYISYEENDVFVSSVPRFSIEIPLASENNFREGGKVELQFELLYYTADAAVSSFDRINPTVLTKKSAVLNLKFYSDKLPQTFHRVNFDIEDYHSFLDISVSLQRLGYKVKKVQTFPLSVEVSPDDLQKFLGDSSFQVSPFQFFVSKCFVLYKRLYVATAELFLKSKNIGNKRLIQQIQLHLDQIRQWIACFDKVYTNERDFELQYSFEQPLLQMLLTNYELARNAQFLWHIYCDRYAEIADSQLRRTANRSILLILAEDYKSLFGQDAKQHGQDINHFALREAHNRCVEGLCYNRLIYDPNFNEVPFVQIDNGWSLPVQSQRRNPLRSLVVFVHGYKGSENDLVTARNFMRLYSGDYCDEIFFDCPRELENSCIEEQGKALALKIKESSSQYYNNYHQISFVGYSLGGMVTRAALTYLDQNFLDKLGLLITLASPHLGMLDCSNSLVNFGVLFMSMLQQNKVMHQLRGQNQKSGESLISKLAKTGLLAKFKRIVVVGSPQDEFVPYASALLNINLCSAETKPLCSTLLSSIPNKVERITARFWIKDISSVDKMLGRRAHILFLENFQLLRFLFFRYRNEL